PWQPRNEDESLVGFFLRRLRIWPFLQKNLQSLFAPGNFRKIEHLLASIACHRFKARLSPKNFGGLRSVKGGFPGIAAVSPVQSCQVAMGIMHVRPKPKRSFESKYGAFRLSATRHGDPEIEMSNWQSM